MNASCHFPPWYPTVTQNMRTITYDILPFPYFLLGMPGHVILLIGFHRQAKHEKAYVYQVHLTATKICEILAISLSILFQHLGGLLSSSGAEWFRRSYTAQLVAAHVIPAFSSSVATCAVLTTLAMAVDRTIAATRPIYYKRLNQKLISRLAAGICLILSVFLSLWIGFLREIVPSGVTSSDGAVTSRRDNDTLNGAITYSMRYAEGGLFNTPWGKGITLARNYVRGLAVVLLIVCNVVLAMYLRQNTKKMSTMVISSQLAIRTASDNARLALAICQSCVILALCIPETAFAVVVAINPTVECWMLMISAYLDGSRQVVDIVDILLILAINRRMRQTFARAIPIGKMWKAITGGVGGGGGGSKTRTDGETASAVVMDGQKQKQKSRGSEGDDDGPRRAAWK